MDKLIASVTVKYISTCTSIGYKATEMTEEQLQRRQQRAKKRREQAQEKREKDKVSINYKIVQINENICTVRT